MTDFSRLQERYEDFWARRNRTPILLLSGMRGAPDSVPAPERLEDRWLDTAYLVARERARLASSFFLGDAFPLVNPNLGPDFFGATFGAGLRFEETTSFAVPFVEDWTEELSFSEDNFWWKKMLEITEAFVEDSRGAYMVGVTDLHSARTASSRCAGRKTCAATLSISRRCSTRRAPPCCRPSGGSLRRSAA